MEENLEVNLERRVEAFLWREHTETKTSARNLYALLVQSGKKKAAAELAKRFSLDANGQ